MMDAGLTSPPSLEALQAALARALRALPEAGGDENHSTGGIDSGRVAHAGLAAHPGQPAFEALLSSPQAVARQCRFLLLLAKWNRVYNLTAVRSPHDMVTRHLADCLSILPWLPSATSDAEHGIDVIDVGTGAGLPVLPLALARPDLQFGSIESNRRKTRFQRQAMIELGIDNVSIADQRVEQVIAQGHFPLARCVVSRAFIAPEAFLSLAARLLLPGGQAVVMLGQAERMPAILSGWDIRPLIQTHRLDDAPRHLALCQRCLL